MNEREIPVVAVVTFPLNQPPDPDSRRRVLEAAGPECTNLPGLRRKYFLMGDGEAGGVYEWDCRASAEAFFDQAWYAGMADRYGARPQVRLFDSPAIADGLAHRLDIYLPSG